MFKFLNIYLPYFASASTLVPVSYGIIKFKTLNTTLRVLLIYLCCCIISDITCEVLFITKTDNTFVLNLFTVAEFMLISAIYLIEFKNSIVRTLLVCSLLVFISFSTLQFMHAGINNADYSVKSLESILIGLTAVLLLPVMFQAPRQQRLGSYYFYWVNAAFLICFLISFCVFLFEQYRNLFGFITLQKNFIIYMVIYIVKNGLLAFGIYKYK